MARPFNENARPGLPTHRSYHVYDMERNHNIGGAGNSNHLYEGYDITPRELPLDENRGRWYCAHTKRMPIGERDLGQFVRKQELSDYIVGDAMFDRKMQGSKREHIYDFIAKQNASNPGLEYEVRFLKLNRSHKQRDSKKPRPKTLSMQIILERRLRPHGNNSPPLPRSMSSQGPIRATGGPLTSDNAQGITITGTITPPVIVQNPQYLPPYAKPRDSTAQNSLPKLQNLHIPNASDRICSPMLLRSATYDSDDSATFPPASPSSTLSSDTACSSVRRASSSSCPIDGAFIFASRPNDKGTQEHRSPYMSLGTQTDVKQYSYVDIQLADTDITCLKPQDEQNEYAKRGVSSEGSDGMCIKGQDRYSNNKAGDEQVNRTLGTTKEVKDILFEKPPWMDNMQPEVKVRMAINENLGPPSDPVVDQSAAKSEGKSHVETPIDEGHKQMNMTPGNRPGNAEQSDLVTKPDGETTSPTIDSKTSSEHIPGKSAPVRKDITISEYLSELPTVTRLSMADHMSLPISVPLAQTQPRGHLDDASSRQIRSKSVRFDLSPQASTAPSTSSPPSSPDTTSPSTSTEFNWAPKSAAASTSTMPTTPTPKRPSLQRSSHSSSSYQRSSAPQLPQPPRSSSYRELPRTQPNNEEKDWWSKIQANTNRRLSASAQNPAIEANEGKSVKQGPSRRSSGSVPSRVVRK